MLNMLKSLIRKIIGEKHDDKLRFLRRFINDPAVGITYAFTNVLHEPDLAKIGTFHKTDKADSNHSFMNLSYLDIYEKYFYELRDKNISILEIGVNDGASLRVWKSYFKHAMIYGIDIDPRCKRLEEKRISIENGSQDDVDFLQNCFGQGTKFDVIIDDGSHINSFTIKSFEYLFNNRLNSGGIYIIEDLGCSYDKLQTNHNIIETWPGMKFNDPTKMYDNNRKDMDVFFLDKIKKLDHLEGNILSIHFWSMFCVIIKA
ncbi:MAG: class I SAM-dependent methyltransferase [Geobacteraceae bacterium]|nr:class I SAM-dependent methyltransferase [Geobacteraceae bacterium]NTW80177.1 class I SAM-dependent methyltransferase [Geobacteraceae bacterium]